MFQKWHQIICYRKYVWSYHFKMVYIFFNKQFKTQHQNKNKDDLQWKIWMGFGGYLADILRFLECDVSFEFDYLRCTYTYIS